MLVIDAGLLDLAAERLMMAAREAKDEQGLRVMIGLPEHQADAAYLHGPVPDHKRIRAIVLAAVISLTGETCRISDEVHVVGFGLPELRDPR